MIAIRKTVVACLTVFAILLSAPVVRAENGEQWMQTFQECMEKKQEEIRADEERYAELDPVMRDISGVTTQSIKNNARSSCKIKASVLHPIDGLSGKLSSFWNDPVGKFTRAVMEGNTESMRVAMTFWMNDAFTNEEQVDRSAKGVANIVLGLAGLALIGSFIIGGLRLAASRRSGLQDGIEDMGAVLGRWFAFSTLVPAGVAGGLAMSDALAKALMEQFGASDANAFVELAGISETSLGPVLTLILVIIAFCGSFMQMLALVIRVLILPIAAGFTPLFAALSFTESGKSGLNHLIGFIIAGIIFKPVSAVLYCVVLWNVSTPGGEGKGLEIVINALMIGIAGFMAPALVRSIVPAVSQAGGGNAAGMLAAGATGASLALGGASSLAGKGASLVAGPVGAAGAAVAGAAASGVQKTAGAAAGAAGAATGGGGGGGGMSFSPGGTGAATSGGGSHYPSGSTPGPQPQQGTSAPSSGGSTAGSAPSSASGTQSSPASASSAAPAGMGSSASGASSSTPTPLSGSSSGRSGALSSTATRDAIDRGAPELTGITPGTNRSGFRPMRPRLRGAASGALRGAGEAARVAGRTAVKAAPVVAKTTAGTLGLASKGAQHMGHAARGAGSMFEGSLGYPGQVHR